MTMLSLKFLSKAVVPLVLTGLIACQSRMDKTSVLTLPGSNLVGGSSVVESEDIAKSAVLLFEVTLKSDAAGTQIITDLNCTATLISQDLLITSAHCMRLGTSEDQPLSADKYIIAYFGTEAFQTEAFLNELYKFDFTGHSKFRAARPIMVRVSPDWKRMSQRRLPTQVAPSINCLNGA